MNLSLIIVCGVAAILLSVLLMKALQYWFQHKMATTGVYILFLITLLSSILLMGATGFIPEGNFLYADITLGGSLIISIISIIFLGIYIILIYGKFPYLTTSFIILSVANITSLFYHPWEITYVENIGYNQPISYGYLIIMICLFINIFLMLLKTTYKIGEKVKETLSRTNDQGNLDESSIKQMAIKLHRKHKISRRITWLYGIGLLTSSIGFFPGFYYVDVLSVLIAFIPITYSIVKNPDILVVSPTQIYGSFIVNESGINLVEYTPWISLDSSLVSGGISAFRDFITKICQYKEMVKEHTEILQFNQMQVVVLSHYIGDTVIRMFTFVNQSNAILSRHLKKILKLFINENENKLMKTNSALPSFTDFSHIMKERLDIYEN